MAPLGWLLWALGHLPLKLLYLLADFIALLARCVVRYRLKIVSRNVADCFPNLSENERSKIVKRFYRHLADYFVETLRFPYMSERELKERMQFADTQLVDHYLAQGRDIVIYTSHLGNWEWITSLSLWCGEAVARGDIFSHVYRPLKQPWFDRWWLNLRQRFNRSIPMKSVMRQLLLWRREGKRWITGFLSDQKPSHAGRSIEVEFLSRPTPFIYGTEELARRLDAVVLMFDTEVKGRGRYKSTIRLITDNASQMPEGEITRLYADYLTRRIRQTPEAYLWSHNRWRLSRASL